MVYFYCLSGVLAGGFFLPLGNIHTEAKMNTSVQIKTHTNKSASFRNVENLRESEQFKNPHIEILKRTPDYKFEDDVTPPVARADKKSEKQRQEELRKINNKINTYSKRLEVFKSQNNTKKIESLTKQIADLKMQKEDLKAIKTAPETRGKKRAKNYMEFIFALTKSNQYIHNVDMQNVLKRAFERMQKTKIIKQLTGITGALHLDQHSLHIHYIAKLPAGQTWDSIVNQGFKNNPEKDIKENAKEKKKISAKTYKNIQNTFQKFVKEEILKSDLSEKTKLVHFFHEKGRKYIPLSKYKKLNPIKNEIIENKEPLEALKPPKDDLGVKDIVLEDKINPRANIDDLDMEDIDFNMEDIIQKDEKLEKLISTMEKNTSGKSKLLDKLNEIDKKLNEDEPQEPTKNRSVRKNR